MTPLRADLLRDIPLERVALCLGYRRDTRDKARWKRPGSVLSINGSKFYDHLQGAGGGGAIDLVLLATGCRFPEALRILHRIAAEQPAIPSDPDPGSQVRQYLERQRGIATELIRTCFRHNILAADRRTNAVFIARDAHGNHTGAEIVGTRPGNPFKGMAPGSCKARGGFWIARGTPQNALLVESAIDALSAYQLPEMDRFDLFLSTAGLATRLSPWINAFPLQHIACGYDADPHGDQAAKRLLRSCPRLRRIRPHGAKDWNEYLQRQNTPDSRRSA